MRWGARLNYLNFTLLLQSFGMHDNTFPFFLFSFHFSLTKLRSFLPVSHTVSLHGYIQSHWLPTARCCVHSTESIDCWVISLYFDVACCLTACIWIFCYRKIVCLTRAWLNVTELKPSVLEYGRKALNVWCPFSSSNDVRIYCFTVRIAEGWYIFQVRTHNVNLLTPTTPTTPQPSVNLQIW